MEKAASVTTLYHSFSMPELVGCLLLDLFLLCVSRLHKFYLRFITHSSRTRTVDPKSTRTETRHHEEEEEEEELRREDVEMVMEKIGMSICPVSERLDEATAVDGISSMFEDEEPTLKEVKAAFSVFDDNCDGFIDAVELQRVLCRLGFSEGGVDIDSCRLMIETYDLNRDGRIDFSEFVQFMESSFY